MTDEAEAPLEDETGPVRRCVATGVRGPREAMLRFVVAPDATLVFDPAAKLPGRGIWLQASADAIAQALKRRAFARAARRPVAVAEALKADVEQALVGRCCATIGLARKGGIVIAGFEKVTAALARRADGLLLIAADAGPSARQKLGAAGRSLAIHAVLTGDELGSVFGRDRAVHVLVGPGALADRLALDLARLAGVRGGTDSSVAIGADGV